LTITVNMHEAKSQLSRLVERVCQGEEVIIAKDGDPVARLVPVRALGKRPVGLFAGKLSIAEDFNAPLPDEFAGAAG